MPSTITGRSLARAAMGGTLWEGAARVISICVSAPTAVLLARWLGPAQYGLLGVLGSLIAFVSIIAGFGIPASVARFLARDAESPGRVAAILRWGILLKVATASSAVLVLLLLSSLTSTLLHEPNLRWLIPFGALVLFLSDLADYTNKIFEGLGRLDLRAACSVANSVVYASGALLLVRAGLGVRGAVLGQACGLCASLLIAGHYIYAKFAGPAVRPTGVRCRELLRYSLPLLVTSASFYVYTQSAMLLIQLHLGGEAVGLYYLPLRLIETLRLPATACGAAMGSLFARVARERPASLPGMYSAAVTAVLLVYMPAAVVVGLLARPLVQLVFGVQYLGAVPVLQMLAPYLLAFALSSVLSLALDYLGRGGLRAMVVGSSATLSVLLNLWAVPRFGIVGAAAVTECTYLPVAFLYVWFGSATCRVAPRRLLGTAARVGSAAIAMAACILLLRNLAESMSGLIAVLGASATVYALGLVTTGILTVEHLRSGRAFLPGRR